MRLDPSEGIAVFTDGSARWQCRTGGWAWVALDAFEGIETGSGAASDTSIGQMELYAPAHALETLLGAFGPIDVLVYSDAQYVVQGITRRQRKRNKNKDYWKKLDAMVDAHRYVKFEHTRGHAGDEYNEMADQLAGEARRNEV